MGCSVYYLFVFSGLYGVQCWWAFLGWIWKQWNTWNSENWIHEPSFNQVELWLLLQIFSLMIAYLFICSFWEFALTDFGFHYLFSVRLNERKQRGVENNKKMAYLVDLKTINVGKWKRHSPEVRVSYGGMGRSSVFTIEGSKDGSWSRFSHKFLENFTRHLCKRKNLTPRLFYKVLGKYWGLRIFQKTNHASRVTNHAGLSLITRRAETPYHSYNNSLPCFFLRLQCSCFRNSLFLHLIPPPSPPISAIFSLTLS